MQQLAMENVDLMVAQLAEEDATNMDVLQIKILSPK